MNNKQARLFFMLGISIGVLIFITGLISIHTPDFYFRESAYWKGQCYIQDIINLTLILPCLILSASSINKQNNIGLFILPGTLLYLVYTFVIYCFNVHFNTLFIFYCCILGLCVYTFAYFFYIQVKSITGACYAANRLSKISAVYFIAISISFYVLWLSDLLPSILHQKVSATLTLSGLATNPVQVLDLAVILPGFFISGVLLLQRKQAGLAFAPIFLSFSILMDITIAALSYMANTAERTNVALISLMLLLALSGSILLTFFIRSFRRIDF